jgi:cytochrome c oxidase subunit 2
VAGSRRTRRLLLAGLLVVAGFALSGCSLADLPRFGWPLSPTPQGREMQEFWSVAFIGALVIGCIVWGLMFWCFAVYRKRANSPLYPKQTKENLPIELAYTAIPLVLVAILFYITVSVQNTVTKIDPNPDVKIDVTAFKWNWDFGYEGTTAPGGGLVHTIGSSTEIPILVVPVKKTLQYQLSSRDVVHSFWVPAFNDKRDVFPDPAANNTQNLLQNSIDYPGAWVGRCAELCGTFHSAMNFEVRAVPDDVYLAYIRLRETVDPTTGVGYTAAGALTKLQTQFPDCGTLCSPTATTTYPLVTDRGAKSASQPAGGK